jgi:small subunit ribosomal protein S21
LPNEIMNYIYNVQEKILENRQFQYVTNKIWTQKGARNLKDIEVRVIDNDIEKAIRILKKKIQNDGLFKRLKLKKSYEKPSEYRRRKMREALRRERLAAARAARYRRR